jgi:hypothetical protein
MCHELQIPFLDPYDAFVARKSRSLYVPGDGHFSEVGHAVYAMILAEFVRAHTSDTAAPL